MPLPIPISQIRKRLVQENLVTEDRFNALAAEADRKNQSILDVLVSQKVVDSAYLNNLIATLLGVDRADLANRPVDEKLVKLLNEELARQREVIVFSREPDGVLDVAMANPGDLETIIFLSQHLKSKIKPFLATADDLNRGYSVYGLQQSQDYKRLIEQNIQESLRGQAKTIEEAAAELPIVAIVNNLLSYAIASRASDVHIEVLEDSVLVRYRVDGIMLEIMRIPKAIHPALAARLKLLAGLKIDEHYRPQDGRFRYQIVNQLVDVRVSVLPTFYGEKVEMRLLEASQKPLSLEELGMLPETAKVVAENLKKAYGMIISCGPTGSGKTTTLYALMNILNRTQVNIVTIEDPVEYNMRYVNQIQVNPQAGITFASGLRSILRQDPNIIMVGEIRDEETAGIAVQAALTGHLLLSSLHTNDAPTTIPRLFDLKIPPFLVSSVLNVVVAQRLVRKICQTCLSSYEPEPSVKKLIETELKDLGVGAAEVRMPKVFYHGSGCSACGGSGYRGRMGIFEVLSVTDKVRKTISDSDFDLTKLGKVAREEGSRTMFEDGLLKVELGQTTIQEIFRVVRE